MTRKFFIERTLRQIYNGQPSDDATITVNLVNSYLNDAIGVAAKKNYIDSIQLDGVAYVNSSFYTTFKSLSVTKDSTFLWKIQLPQIPFGIGSNEGVSTCVFKDASQVSYPIVWLTQNQLAYQRSMRPIPNKILGYSEGEFVYAMTTIMLSQFTAQVTMVSGGLSTDLNSTLNVPADYFEVMVEYLKKQLMFERSVPVDANNDGLDAIKTI